MKNARRCAPFGPMPGSRCSSSMRRRTGSGRDIQTVARSRSSVVDSVYPSEFQPRHQAAHLRGEFFLDLAVGVVDRGEDHVLQHLDVLFRHHLGVDLQRLQLLVAVDDDRDHAAAGGRLDAEFGHLLLKALLHLLRLLHHLLDVHISSTSRISAGKTSSSALTPASASACSFSAVFRSVLFGWPPPAAGSLSPGRPESPPPAAASAPACRLSTTILR